MRRNLRRTRKGDVFMFGLDILFFIAIVIIFWKVAGAFSAPQGNEGLGTRQTATLNTYATSEHMLLYLDEAAKFAANDAFISTMTSGGRIDVGSQRTGTCQTYASYDLWTQDGQECFPAKAGNNGQDVIRNNALDVFKKEVDKNLLNIMRYPGFPVIRSYTYDQTAVDETGIIVRGITKDLIRLPIITAKGAAQERVTPILLQDNVIQNEQNTFRPDTTLPGVITIPSPNRKQRTSAISHLIIHGSETIDATTAMSFYIGGTESTHYLIDEAGHITQLVPEDQVAFHMPPCDAQTLCAISGQVMNANKIEHESISITLANSGRYAATSKDECEKTGGEMLSRTKWCGINDDYKGTPGVTCAGDEFKDVCWAKYPQAQIDALRKLVGDIMQRQNIKAANVKFEEEVRYASHNPGPALHEQGKTQSDLLASIIVAKTNPEDFIGPQAPQEQATPLADSTISVQWPVASDVITGCFGERSITVGDKTRTKHYGIDLKAKLGDDVKSVASGQVTFIGYCTPASCPDSGNNVVVKSSETFYLRYSHLSKINVKQGDTVLQGASIGQAGSTGSSEGPHLDLKVYTGSPNNLQNAIDPLCIFPDAILQKKTFDKSATSCTFGEGTLSHANPKLAQECAGVDTHPNTPTCSVNTQFAAVTGNSALTKTLKDIDDQKGLRETIDKAAAEQKIDAKLMIAIIAQESGGRPDLISPTGCAGLGQFCLGTAQGYTDIFGSGLRKCSCPGAGSCTAAQAQCTDEPRMDPIKNANAMARLIKQKASTKAFQGTKDVILFTIASYNGGEGVIQKALKRTGKSDPSWQEVSDTLQPEDITYAQTTKDKTAKVAEIRNYVKKVSAYYTDLGGKTGSFFQDQTCGDVTIKELGSYTFAPSFTAKVPNLLATFDSAIDFGKRLYVMCDGRGGMDNRQCLKDEVAKSGSNSVACDGTNESIIESLAETILDCKNNLQTGCTCTWTPPQQWNGKNLTIDIYTNHNIVIYSDNTLVATEPTSLNQPLGTPSARFQENPTANAAQGVVRYTMTYNSNILVSTIMEVGPTPSRKIDIPSNKIVLYKPDDDISWMIAPGADAQSCGLYKTTNRVCIGTKQPIYSLSRGTTFTPVIRFAIDLKDETNPEAVNWAHVDDRANTGSTTGISAGTGLVISFTPSTSKDISYYTISCASLGQFTDTVDKFEQGRDKDNDMPLQGTIRAEIKTCDGLPINPLVSNYKFRITPVDISGNDGEPAVCDLQAQKTKEEALQAATEGVSIATTEVNCIGLT